MALPDLTDIRTEVRRRIAMSSSDTQLDDTVLTGLVNAAIRKLSLMHDWPWLIATDATWTATVAGTAGYTPASDWRKTLYIVVDDDQLMQLKQPQDIWRYSQQDGFPLFYTVENGTISLYPNPDAVYNVRHVYVKTETALSNDTDEPLVPLWALDLVIELAAVLAAKRLRDRELAREMEAEFQYNLDSIKDDIRKTRQHPVPKHRTDVGWS